MSEIREPINKSIERVMNGSMGVDVAEAVHKLAHRHVMDRYAEVAEEKLRGVRGLREANSVLAGLCCKETGE